MIKNPVVIHLAARIVRGWGGCILHSHFGAKQIAIQQVKQLGGMDRLRDIGIHAHRQAFLFVALHCMRGHGDDRGARAARRLHVADRRRGLEAAHFGHLDVHQNNIEGLGMIALDRLASVVGDFQFIAALGQQIFRHGLVDRIVLGQQDAAAALVLARGRRMHDMRRLFLQRRGFIRKTAADAEMKHAAMAEFAFDPDFAAHHLGQARRNGQPQAGAAVLARGRGIGLRERLKDQRQLFR